MPWTSPPAPRGHVGYGVSRRSIARSCRPTTSSSSTPTRSTRRARLTGCVTTFERAPRPIYRIGAHRYFKYWTLPGDGPRVLDRARPRRRPTALPAPTDRAGVAPCDRPHPRPAGGGVRDLALGYRDVPPDVAVFHHGSYVGPRRRISDKLASFGHAHEVSDRLDRAGVGPLRSVDAELQPGVPLGLRGVRRGRRPTNFRPPSANIAGLRDTWRDRLQQDASRRLTLVIVAYHRPGATDTGVGGARRDAGAPASSS